MAAEMNDGRQGGQFRRAYLMRRILWAVAAILVIVLAVMALRSIYGNSVDQGRREQCRQLRTC